MIRRNCSSALWLLVLLLTVCMTFGCSGNENSSSQAASSASAATESSASVSSKEDSSEDDSVKAVPYAIEDGRLVITSVFESDIENIDGSNAYVESLASIEIRNDSDECMVSGDFEVTMADGQMIAFHVDYLPAGQTVMAFSTEGKTIGSTTDFTKVSSRCEFTDQDLILTDALTILVNDTEVKLQNFTDRSFSNVVVYCHCRMDDVLFGGLAYAYPLDEIKAATTTFLDAEDCYWGEAEVVCIEIK